MARGSSPALSVGEHTDRTTDLPRQAPGEPGGPPGYRPAGAGAQDPGLVICAITARPDHFPGSEQLEEAASWIPGQPEWNGRDPGPHTYLYLSPGVIAAGRVNHLQRQHTEEKRAARLVDLVLDLDMPGRQQISGWSAKSRRNFFRTMGELDYAPMFARGGTPAMITLTYPGDWLTVAPTGEASKRHLTTFRKRWIRAWGYDPEAVWKLEFQRRGAPHYHLFVTMPHGLAGGLPFRQWLSVVWAEIVDHPDALERMKHEMAGTGVDVPAGLRASDPRRVAAYFLKHGGAAAKEYQHDLPPAWQDKGPGRWWGYWRLQKAVVQVPVDELDYIAAVRLLRRWSTAKNVSHQVTVKRGDRRRRVRRPLRLMHLGAGWVAANNGAQLGRDIGRYLSMGGPDGVG